MTVGCLTVNVKPLSSHGVHVEVENKNDISLTAMDMGSRVSVTADPMNAAPVVSVTPKNITLEIRAGLICQVSLQETKVIYVGEGPLMVAEGYLILE